MRQYIEHKAVPHLQTCRRQGVEAVEAASDDSSLGCCQIETENRYTIVNGDSGDKIMVGKEVNKLIINQ